jgi:hypothetical protein
MFTLEIPIDRRRFDFTERHRRRFEEEEEEACAQGVDAA